MATLSELEQILDLARWAPSGDNTQPWRFELTGDGGLVIHGHDTRDHCVYDLEGHPSQISIGALLETMAIAASSHGLRMQAERRTGYADTRPTFDVRFEPDQAITPDPLIPFITQRSVQRRPLHTRPLTQEEKSQVEAAAGPGYDILWLEGFSMRLRIALLMFHNAKLRLTMPEAYQVHRDVIEWNARYSEDRIPDQALGVDPMTTRVMRFVMKSWERVDFFNRFLAGTWAPRLQMDLVPGIACAAHFVVKARTAPSGIDDYVAAGRAVQRVWLTLTALGLQMQPELTPLIFSAYVRAGMKFTRVEKIRREAEGLARNLTSVIGDDCANAVFMARTGAGPAPRARSTRLSVERLMQFPR